MVGQSRKCNIIQAMWHDKLARLSKANMLVGPEVPGIRVFCIPGRKKYKKNVIVSDSFKKSVIDCDSFKFSHIAFLKGKQKTVIDCDSFVFFFFAWGFFIF